SDSDDAAAALGLLTLAERLLGSGEEVQPEAWHEYLEATGRPAFLLALPDVAHHSRWAETTFQAILVSGYSLRTMLHSRAREHGDRILFEDRRELDAPSWSYAEVASYAREVAGVFLLARPAPRVAIFCDNSVDSAVVDLACLSEGILVTPLSIHTDAEGLASILARLDINVVVTDADDRHELVADACHRLQRTVALFRTGSRTAEVTIGGITGHQLRQACAELDLAEVDRLLLGRVPDLQAPATVMFTSGSTGQSKGLVFSQLMLVAKRFARAAALPSVGDGEVLLCYLPLFHTFGRYLEMLGTIFWRGTYVFAGNPSAEALIAEMGRVRPTGLISIPLRWSQIREAAIDSSRGGGDDALRRLVGDRLRWGLSAAGYLDPKVFRFFHRYGIDLCSGFGMTEATGGITMTPPGDYDDGSVGVPLPGMRTRLTGSGELEIAGIYVAEYLDDHAADGLLPARVGEDREGAWIPTGDLFQLRPNGHYEIVDRVKDIYKNSRGQTIAPQRVEQRFAGVPGFRSAFLAGDHRDHNVLLIAADADEPLLASRTPDEVHEYFAHIVATVNAGLAPYERVVNFALLDREFSADKSELTPKGSFRRKAIEASFAAVIEKLYESNYVELAVGAARVRIARWIYRDLGILEDDIVAGRGELHNRRSNRSLRVVAGEQGEVIIGDLQYVVSNGLIDLSLFARQPRLWLGNPALIAFVPCKDGWDMSLRDVSPRVRIVDRQPIVMEQRPRIADDHLRDIHHLATVALFGSRAEAREAVERLGGQLPHAGAALGSAIRTRLEALAFHPEEEVRAIAYRTLLLDTPLIDDQDVFPAFLDSGLTFLNEESIAAIATAKPAERRLHSLRQRMYSYRTQMAWPGPSVRRRQFRRVFRLLVDFARENRADFATVQAELAAWALFRADHVLAAVAQRHFDELTSWYDGTLAAMNPPKEAERQDAEGKVIFEYGIAPGERARVEAILFDPTFLRHSIASAFGDEDFEWVRVAPTGVWVSPMLSHHQLRLYRLGINLVDGRHFDLLLVTGPFLRKRAVKDTILWITALSGHAYGTPLFPRFGAWRKDLGATSVVYVNDLTAWERLRQLSGDYDLPHSVATRLALRKVYVRAMAAFFRAWEQSGYRVVPGAVTPANVALPEADFLERTSILSLAGWKPYEGPLSLVRPMVRSFYRLAVAHYPQVRDSLQLGWIFDACIEALGAEHAAKFFDELHEALRHRDPSPENSLLSAALTAYLAALAEQPHIPLGVICAVDRYREWERMNPSASPDARQDTISQLAELYRIAPYGDAQRYYLFRQTYFATASPEVREALDRLIARRLRDGGALAGHLEELSAVQSRLTDAADRRVFSRMIFPHAHKAQRLELHSVGHAGDTRVIVRSEVHDSRGIRFIARDPVSAVEVGHLYRMFAETDYPLRIGENDRQLVITDPEERIVGGLCYRKQEAESVYVDGIVVERSLINRGLGGRLLEDFCVRMAADGARLVKTNFFLGGLFTKHGFQVSDRWGGLVRFLVG
ncbi:MAG: AMP-binding protein, partial [Thermoanaerobaculia bacterium]